MHVTHRRVFLPVSGVWISAYCVFIIHYIHDGGTKLRSICYMPDGVLLFLILSALLPLILIFFLNFDILFVARKQRKRILPTTTASVESSTEESANRMNFAAMFFVAIKTVKTVAFVVVVLTVCNLITNRGWADTNGIFY